VLLSAAERARAERIAERISYVELTTFPGFQRLFAHAMRFSELPASEPQPGELQAGELQAGEPQNDTTGG